MSAKVLISLLGRGASWSGPAELTPWSVFVIVNGTPVLDGGEYPDECVSSHLIVSDVSMQAAERVAEALEGVLRELNADVCKEVLADG